MRYLDRTPCSLHVPRRLWWHGTTRHHTPYPSRQPNRDADLSQDIIPYDDSDLSPCSTDESNTYCEADTSTNTQAHSEHREANTYRTDHSPNSSTNPLCRH